MISLRFLGRAPAGHSAVPKGWGGWADDEVGRLEVGPALPHVDLAALIHDGIGRDAGRDPDVAADHAACPDDGLAAQDGGVGVDDDVVFDRRMSLGRGQRLGDGERAQGHALVELHVVADHGCFADDDAGAVVDDHRMA